MRFSSLLSPLPFRACLRLSLFIGLLCIQTACFGVTVLWDVDFNQLGIAPGSSVNSATNPWWQSSSPRSRFLIDENLLVIASQPGHILSNIQPIQIAGPGHVSLELLIRTDEPSTLNLRSDSGYFDSPSGVIRGNVLEVPSIEAQTFTWVSFDWIQSLSASYQDNSIWGESAESTSTPLSFFIASVDNPFYLAAARLTFTPAGVPEPGRAAMAVAGLFVALLRRTRQTRR